MIALQFKFSCKAYLPKGINLPHVMWQHVLLLGHVVTKDECVSLGNNSGNLQLIFAAKTSMYV